MLNESIRVTGQDLCMLCDNEGTLLYQNLRDRLFSAPGAWALLRCSKCGLVWIDPQPIPEDIGELYRDYFTHNPASKILKKKPRKSLRKTVRISVLNVAFGYKDDRANKLLGRLVSCLGLSRDTIGGTVMWLDGTRPGKLLDVGCGDGQFLANMRELGWEVHGVEPDGQAVKAANQKFGLNVHEGALEKISFPDNTFDAITMSHVIEHLPNPIGTLRECKRMLKKGGRLVMTAPNIESLAHRLYRDSWLPLDPPRHLFLYSPSTLRTCVERSGLRIMELRTTARTARETWAASRLIKRNGALPGLFLQNQGAWQTLLGRAFRLLEYGLCQVTDVGEEIVLTASK